MAEYQIPWDDKGNWSKFSFLGLDFSIMRIYDDYILYGPRSLFDNTTVTISEHTSLDEAKKAGAKSLAKTIEPVVYLYEQIMEDEEQDKHE